MVTRQSRANHPRKIREAKRAFESQTPSTVDRFPSAVARQREEAGVRANPVTRSSKRVAEPRLRDAGVESMGSGNRRLRAGSPIAHLILDVRTHPRSRTRIDSGKRRSEWPGQVAGFHGKRRTEVRGDPRAYLSAGGSISFVAPEPVCVARRFSRWIAS